MNLNVKLAMAVMLKRKASSSLNSGIAETILRPLTIFSVAKTEGISTGIQIGKSKKDKSKVFPSENITSPETKEPANERSTIPRKKMSRNSTNLPESLRFRNTLENRSNTDSTRKSSTIA